MRRSPETALKSAFTSLFWGKKEFTLELPLTKDGFGEAPKIEGMDKIGYCSLRRYDDYTLALIPPQKPDDPPFILYEGSINVRVEGNELHYLILSPIYEVVTGVITKAELGMSFQGPLDFAILQEKLPTILKITSERGHTSSFHSDSRNEDINDNVTRADILTSSKEVKRTALQMCLGLALGTFTALDQKAHGSYTGYSAISLAFCLAGILFGERYLSQHKQTFDQSTNFKKFDQADFDAQVKRNLPDKKYNDANCAGHVNMWHKFHSRNLDYIQFTEELSKSLTAKQLTEEQIKNIDDIMLYQSKNQGFYTPRLSNFFPGTNAWLESFNTLRKDTLALALEKATKCPGTLVCYLLKFRLTNSSGHMTGIIADEHGQIKFFDPLRGEATFADPASAKRSISRFLAFEYGLHIDNMGPYLPQDKETTSTLKSKM